MKEAVLTIIYTRKFGLGLIGSLFALFLSISAVADIETYVVDGPRTYGPRCEDPNAIGPLTGLYRQDSGGYVCIFDYGQVIVFPNREGSPSGRFLFSARLERHIDVPSEIGGYLYVRTLHGNCSLQGTTKILPLPGGGLLWTKSTFVVDTDYCDQFNIRMDQDRLKKINLPPVAQWRCTAVDAVEGETHPGGHVSESAVWAAAYSRAYDQCMESHSKCKVTCKVID